MDDYTPTVEQVRAAYVRGMRDTFVAAAADHEAEFDRWLAQHDREDLPEDWRDESDVIVDSILASGWRPPPGAKSQTCSYRGRSAPADDGVPF